MRIPSGSTDRYVYFVAVDATDLKSRETGFSSFTVRRSRNGGASAAYTTPTINETDTSNMPGVYELLLDEDTTLDSGHDTEEYVVHITHAGMAPVTRVVEIYRPKGTEGRTASVDASGNASADLVLVDGAAVDPAQAQLGANVIQAAGTAWNSGAIGSGTFAADSITGTAAASSFWDEAETAAGVALAAIRLDELLAADSDIDGLTPPTTGSVFFELMSKSGGAFTFDQTEDSLEALRDLAATLGTQVSLDTIYDDMPTAAENGAAAATAVWSDALGGYGGSTIGGKMVVFFNDTEPAINVLTADWLNGGRLDNILDARASQASVDDVPTVAEFEARTLLAASYATAAALSTAQTDLTQIKADLPTRPTKNVALANFPFIMRLSSDHVTGATGKTVTATRRLDNGSFAACANAPTEVAAGTYTIDLANTDMNANTIMLRFTAADCDDTFILIVTQP